MNPESHDFDLEQLCRQALDWLCRWSPSTADGRVQEVPDARTVRYYQTLGLLDKPLRYEGRIARYGRRHLLQLVSVKALQAKGYSLAQVQSALMGRSSEELERALGVEPVSAPSIPMRVAAEIAPGVTIVIDPAFVNDPQALLQQLSRALRSEGESR